MPKIKFPPTPYDFDKSPGNYPKALLRLKDVDPVSGEQKLLTNLHFSSVEKVITYSSMLQDHKKIFSITELTQELQNLTLPNIKIQDKHLDEFKQLKKQVKAHNESLRSELLDIRRQLSDTLIPFVLNNFFNPKNITHEQLLHLDTLNNFQQNKPASDTKLSDLYLDSYQVAKTLITLLQQQTDTQSHNNEMHISNINDDFLTNIQEIYNISELLDAQRITCLDNLTAVCHKSVFFKDEKAVNGYLEKCKTAISNLMYSEQSQLHPEQKQIEPEQKQIEPEQNQVHPEQNQRLKPKNFIKSINKYLTECKIAISNLIHIKQKQIEPEQKQIEPEQKQIEPEQKQIEPEQKQVHTEQNRIFLLQNFITELDELIQYSQPDKNSKCLKFLAKILGNINYYSEESENKSKAMKTLTHTSNNIMDGSEQNISINGNYAFIKLHPLIQDISSGTNKQEARKYISF